MNKKSKINTAIVKSIINTVKNNQYIYKHFNFTYKTQKYRLEDIIPIIIDVLKYGFPWRYINKLDKNAFKNNIKCISKHTTKNSIKNIHWSTIYKTFTKLNSINIFKDTYIEMLKKYIKKSPNKKLKITLSDTSTIYNKYNIDTVKRNAYYKNKKVIKISVITDKYGIPIHIEIYSGNENDINILNKQLNNDFYVEYQFNRNIHKYFLADKGYDGRELRNKIEGLGYIPIIDYNNRNTKDPLKIKKLNKKEKEIYNQRIRVENLFAKIKMHFNRLNLVNEKKIINYEGFLFLALCFIINNEI